jgi:holo-[acyl-carrier protein] synthase
MITGLGVDIVEIDRMKAALERRPRMKERLFSAEERAYCDKRSRPEIHYALRFAAKEAVLKALGSGFSGVRFTDVEVVREANGRPVPRLSGRAAEMAEELGVIEMHLSLSFTHTTAVASAVAITAEARPRKDEAPDPMAELAASFKEARSLLDDVGVTDLGDVAGERDGDGDDVPVSDLARPESGQDDGGSGDVDTVGS